MQRPAAAAIPRHGRLALVGHADGRHRLATAGELGTDGSQDVLDTAPDLVGVVLDPSGPRIVLGQLPVGREERGAGVVHGEGPPRIDQGAVLIAIEVLRPRPPRQRRRLPPGECLGVFGHGAVVLPGGDK